VSEPIRHLEMPVAFIGGKAWYRIAVSVEVALRAQELALGRLGPDWRLCLEVWTTGRVTIDTVDPQWFVELETRRR
jgi:hypothetical protein